MPPEPKPYWGDKYRPFVKIGTAEAELRALADAIVRGAWIVHAQIADLRALIEAVQSHPKVTLRPPKDADTIGEASKVKPTALVIRGGRVVRCDCSELDIRVTLAPDTSFGEHANFFGATFGVGASFGGATFGKHAIFDKATFGERASFDNATFGGQASFGEATFGDEARFDWSTFGDEAIFDSVVFGDQAHFDFAIFGVRSSFGAATFGEQASFRTTSFGDQASLGGAIFGEKADFERVSFGDRASFLDCNLNHASIKDALFDRADLRRTRGILFDETRIAQVQMEGNASDPWSTLRRQYTGPWFFVHLILLVIFFAPYVASIVALTAASKLQENMLEYAEVAEQRLERYQQEHPIAGRVAIDWTDAQNRLSDMQAAYLKDRKKLPAVWILIGGNKGWWVVAMAIVIMFYNVMRALLTLRISALRDAEERSNVTPRLDEYYGICHPLNDEDGNTFVAGIRTWLKGMWSKRLFAVPEWLRRRLPDDLQKRFSPDQPPSLIACVGLYRVHQLARLIMWIAIIATAWNSLEWAKETWLWI